MQRLGGCGDIAEQSGSGLQIPVRIGDVRVSEIGAQCCHVSRNSSAITWTLLQRPHRECVSEIVNAAARVSGTGAQTNRSGQDEKGRNDCGIGKLAPAPGNEEGGGGWCKPATGRDILLQAAASTFMQRNKPAFLELRRANHEPVFGEVR